MDDEDFGEPKNGHVLFHVIYCFAFLTFVSTIVHSFWGGIAAKTFVYVDVACETNSFSRYRNRQIHKVIEGQRFMVTFHTFQLTAKLSFEQIGYYRIISSLKIFLPNF
jgi:hypothetical protein